MSAVYGLLGWVPKRKSYERMYQYRIGWLSGAANERRDHAVVWAVGGFERSLEVLGRCWHRSDIYGCVILGIRSRLLNKPAQRITEPLRPVGRFGVGGVSYDTGITVICRSASGRVTGF